MITVLVIPEDLGREEAQVGGEAYRHLFRARRVAVGERLRVVDGAGGARWGVVMRVERTAAWVGLGEAAPSHEASFHLELFVPTCRPERAAFLVEKGTELGVAAFRFLQTARAPRELTAGALGRLERVAAAALEQCHRSRLPAISGPHLWGEIDKLAAGSTDRWVLDTVGEPGWGPVRGGTGALLIGPEGGWTDGERTALAAAGWRAVHLGETTLRLETAALAGAAIVLLNLVRASSTSSPPA